MKNIERENHEDSEKRSYIDSTNYPDEEELSILGMDENFEQSGKQQTVSTQKSNSDIGHYISQQELKKYTHKELIGNSSGTNKERIEGSAKSLNMFSLSLSESYVKETVENYYRNNLRVFLDRAITRNLEVLETTDLEVGEYRSPCWHLVSELRGYPLFRGITVNNAVYQLDKLINWDALPGCDFFGGEIDPYDELIDAWIYQDNNQIRPLYPPVNPCTVQIFASKYPLSNLIERPNYCGAVSILYWYAQLMSQYEWFFLSAGTLAKMLDCSKRSAAQYIRRAISEGYIQKHIEYAKKDRQATEYIWVGEIKYKDEQNGV